MQSQVILAGSTLFQDVLRYIFIFYLSYHVSISQLLFISGSDALTLLGSIRELRGSIFVNSFPPFFYKAFMTEQLTVLKQLAKQFKKSLHFRFKY